VATVDYTNPVRLPCDKIPVPMRQPKDRPLTWLWTDTDQKSKE